MIVICPSCGKQYQANMNSSGRKFRCGGCGATIDADTNRAVAEKCFGVVLGTRGHTRLPQDREFIIGRELGCDYLIEDIHSSRRHCSIKWNGAAFLLRDFGSRNGTFYNGKLLTGVVPLTDNDVMQVGSESLTFRAVSGEEELRGILNESINNLRKKQTEELPALNNSLPETDFNGNLDNISVSEICQILALGRRSGRLLIIDDSHNRCQIDFVKGEIVFTDYKGKEGEAAALSALRITKGIFEMDSTQPARPRNVTKHTGFLLLEAARQKDEV